MGLAIHQQINPMSNLRYAFFGSPRFAKIVLTQLIEAHLIPTVLICNPDRPSGRKKILTAPETKIFLQTNLPSVPILQPEDPTAPDFAAKLQSFRLDISIIAAYSKILTQSVLAAATHGTVGVHPSLLPQLRGASPIQSAILRGFSHTGVTLYLVDEKMDHGPIIGQTEPIEIADQNYIQLADKLAFLGGKLAAELIPKFIAGSLLPQPQEHSLATFTKRFTTEDGYIPWDDLVTAHTTGQGSIEILRKIRALCSEPGCYTISPDARRIKLLNGQIAASKLTITKWLADGMHRPSSLPLL